MTESLAPRSRKVKILATLGPASSDPKIMRMIVRLRRMETHTRQEQDAVLETYRAALGLA